MARCLDCSNLIKSWNPIVKSDWLFEERWKGDVSSEALGSYYLITKERECLFYEKRPRLLMQLEIWKRNFSLFDVRLANLKIGW